jgi:hypothetical protein
VNRDLGGGAIGAIRMDSLRTGYGLKRLRKQFVTRATTLLKDKRFKSELSDARQWWNETYRDYQIGLLDRGSTEPPRALMNRIHQLRYLATKQVYGELVLTASEMGDVRTAWDYLVSELANRYWPQRNFPYPAPPDAHPARGFVTACLYAHDFLEGVGEVGEYFPPFEMKPEPMLDVRGKVAVWAHNPDPDHGWCLPLFPGITAKDIEDAAATIANEVDRIYGDRRLDMRVRALKDEGLSNRAIARELGISPSNVNKILAQR